MSTTQPHRQAHESVSRNGFAFLASTAPARASVERRSPYAERGVRPGQMRLGIQYQGKERALALSPVDVTFDAESYYVSRLMLLPKRAYRSIFNCSISSRMLPNFSSAADTDSSSLPVDAESRSCTSCSGNDKKVSPTLYLRRQSVSLHQ